MGLLNFLKQAATDVDAPASGRSRLFVDTADDQLKVRDEDGSLYVYITAATVAAGYQPLDGTLTAFAGLTVAANSLTIGTGADAFSQTSFAANTFPARASTGSLVAKTITDFGLSLVDDADAAAARTTLGLGTLATQSGTFSGTSSGTNTGDQTITLTGDVTGSGTGSFAATLATAQPAVHTWALAQTFTVAPVFTDSEGARDALKIGPRYCYESFMDFSAPTIGQTNLGSEWSRPVTGGTSNLDNTAGLASGNSYGRATLNLGTTATNKAAVAHQSNAHALGAGKAQFNIKGCLSSVSDGTDTYVQRNGFMDDVTAEPANGCYFRYTHSVNSGKWQCVTRKAGVETATDSGVTAVAGTERSWRVVVNAGGTSVDFYIDGSIVQTHSTNIPTAGVGAASAAIRSAGTAAKLAMVIDVIHLRVDFTTPRW